MLRSNHGRVGLFTSARAQRWCINTPGLNWVVYGGGGHGVSLGVGVTSWEEVRQL